MEFQTMLAAFIIAVPHYFLAVKSKHGNIEDESTEMFPPILEDWTFKTVMGRDETLISFFNDIVVNNENLSHLNLKKIVKVQLMESTSPKETLYWYEPNIHDMRVQDENGYTYVIEMQRKYQVDIV